MPDSSFVSDWTKPNGGFRGTQAMAADRIAPGPLTPSGAPSMSFTVRPGDNPIGSSGERCEVYGMQTASGAPYDVTATSGTRCYGAEFLFPPDYAAKALLGPTGDWAIPMQCHGPDTLSASPAVALGAGVLKAGDPPKFSIDILGGKVDGNSVPIKYQLGAVPLGVWSRVLFRIKWAADTTGSVMVWQQTPGQPWAQVLAVTGIATLQTDANGMVGSHYWKTGLYRSVSANWDALAIGRISEASTLLAAQTLIGG